MKEGALRLRPLKIWDSLFLRNSFQNKEMLSVNGLNKPIYSSPFLLWWWLKRAFIFSYTILFDSRRIGFIGVYHLKLGMAAQISLFICKKNMRRLGYGSRVFRLLAKNLRRYSIVEKIIVRVRADNHTAMAFWKKNGFVQLSTEGDVTTIVMSLKESP